jgi:hypothetical protein
MTLLSSGCSRRPSSSDTDTATTTACSMTEGSGLFFVVVVVVVVDDVVAVTVDLMAGTVITVVGFSCVFFAADVTIVGISFVTIVSSTGREAAACG